MKRKLVTKKIAVAICADFDNGAGTIPELAQWYQLHRGTIYHILTGKKFADVRSQNYHNPRQHSTERRFSNDQAKQMRIWYHDGVRVKSLMRHFKVTNVSVIRQVLEGKTYKDAGGPIGLKSKRSRSGTN